MLPYRARAFASFVFFVTLLAGIDQGVLRLGRRLRIEQSGVALPTGGPNDILILGSCHAEALRADLLSRDLGKPVLNAGRSAGGIGRMAFNWQLALARGGPRYLVVIVDHWLLGAPTSDAVREVAEHAFDWDRLDDRGREFLERHFGKRFLGLLPLTAIGLWRYRGRGPAFVRAALGLPFETARTPGSQPTTKWESSRGLNKRNPERDWTINRDSVALLGELFRQSRERGIRPIAVISPLNYRQNTREVNQQLVAAVSTITRDNDVPLLNYLDNHNSWATEDQWWADPEHLNRLGNRIFTQTLAQDLRGQIR